MLKIKLARFGQKNQPHYRMVVNEAKDKRDGSYVALVGHYAPTQQPKILEINVEAYQSWIAKGAQPTETVTSLFKKFQSGKPFPPKKKKLSRKAKAKLEGPKEEKSEKKPNKVEAKPINGEAKLEEENKPSDVKAKSEEKAEEVKSKEEAKETKKEESEIPATNNTQPITPAKGGQAQPKQ